MKVKNARHYGDPATLQRLKEEAEYIGRDTKIEGDCLIVFALPRRSKKKSREKQKRDKRLEKFERKSD